ncbi:MAG: oxidoreductase [Candidatus Krumholzibacteriota bacterium]
MAETTEKKKLQIAIYWGAACGGCDVAVLDTDAFILDVAELADIRLWPIAVDGKYADVEAMDDGELDLVLFNGAVRNSENRKIAELLRRKTKVMVALGSCAHLGGIPGLANECSREEIFNRAYLDNPSIEEDNVVLPVAEKKVASGTLEIPHFHGAVRRLSDVVQVEYFVPGCPPAPAQIKAVLLAVATGDLPRPGSVVGASDRALCDECERRKDEKKVTQFRRPWQIIQDPEKCLLEQGIICAGSVTRAGCGVRCPDSGMPCRGCYGPPPNVKDQGAKFISAVSSIVESRNAGEMERVLDEIPDVMGYAYRFGLPASTLQRSTRSQ